MPRPLEAIRANIDALDKQIVTSLFENGSDEEVVFESRDIKAEEIAQIRVLQLRFSAQAWNLLNQRMTLSREV
jgi:chorismate mutase